MDDELKRIEEANAGYESMGMEIAGLKEELEEAKAALQEASEESVDSQLQGFMDDCNALKAEIDKVNRFCHLSYRRGTVIAHLFLSIQLLAGHSKAFKA